MIPPSASRGLGAAACCGLLLAITPAQAHHAIGAVVDLDTEVVGTMTLTKVDWINPHSWFHFTMKAANGFIIPISRANKNIKQAASRCAST